VTPDETRGEVGRMWLLIGALVVAWLVLAVDTVHHH
jgi:hypothetical protein